ncbi:MAG: MauE/DoxX family redox-associated membrane protein [Nanoarchaeota archaeon]|nr:MauE/DoxX family redox-associated membrane protein [Nanoarchaeota archaeon]
MLIQNLTIILILRIFLGLVLLITGLLKVKDLKLFAAVVRTYKLLPEFLINFSSYVLVFAEIIIGALLITGLYAKYVSVIAAFLQTGIMMFIAVALIKHRQMKDCGCFGAAIKMPITWWHVLINAVIVALLLLL